MWAHASKLKCINLSIIHGENIWARLLNGKDNNKCQKLLKRWPSIENLAWVSNKYESSAQFSLKIGRNYGQEPIDTSHVSCLIMIKTVDFFCILSLIWKQTIYCYNFFYSSFWPFSTEWNVVVVIWGNLNQ